MCGRYTNHMSWSEIVEAYRLTDPQTAPNLQPRYNITPTQQVPVIRVREGHREATIMRWGLVPHWSKPAFPR